MRGTKIIGYSLLCIILPIQTSRAEVGRFYAGSVFKRQHFREERPQHPIGRSTGRVKWCRQSQPLIVQRRSFGY
ncbi:MAG: hypothetical protein ACI3ZD_08005, partial [Prevotella sp.]